MRANVNMTGGLILAESIAMRLAPEMGKREAHAAIKRAARRAVGGESFADVLASDPAVSAILDRAAIEQALSPDDYLGSTEAFVAAVLSRRSQRKN
jgi:3-carboxy-cis,cis-muconate cycloisomerase